jgi:hypothetical protein
MKMGFALSLFQDTPHAPRSKCIDALMICMVNTLAYNNNNNNDPLFLLLKVKKQKKKMNWKRRVEIMNF